MEIKLREFNLSDLEVVRKIAKTSFSYSWPEIYFEKLYTEYPRNFFIAETDKKLVGYILGHSRANKSGLIKTLVVDPNYRQQGIGKELMNFTIQRLEREGVKEIFLHTRRKNRVAVSLYKKLEFRIIKTVKDYYRNGDEAYLMKKSLGG